MDVFVGGYFLELSFRVVIFGELCVLQNLENYWKKYYLQPNVLSGIISFGNLVFLVNLINFYYEK